MISTGKVLEWENTDSVGIGKTKFRGTNLRMSHSLTKAECGNVLQQIQKMALELPYTKLSHHEHPKYWGQKNGTLRKQKMVKQIHST